MWAVMLSSSRTHPAFVQSRAMFRMVTLVPGPGFQQESLTDFIPDQYVRQETAFSNVKIFMSKGTVQKEEERHGLNVFQE